MKAEKMLKIMVWALSLVAWLAPILHGAQYLTVDGQDVDSLVLELGESCTITIESDDNAPYVDYIGFDNRSVLGTFFHLEIRPEAGDRADVVEVNQPAFYGYYVNATGISTPPSPGVHFVFQYEALQVGETDLKLYQNSPPPSAGIVLDSVHISVIPLEPKPMRTAFTYKGQLQDANEPADGLYDFEFKLYDNLGPFAAREGNTIYIDELDVIGGYFTVELDFGTVFDGNRRWLEIGVRPGDLSDPNLYTTLSPRQEVTPTPYALYAKTADSVEGVVRWNQISNRPAGLDDGDDLGMTSESDTLESVCSRGSSTSAAIELSGASDPMLEVTHSAKGRAIFGYASGSGAYRNYGGYFQANGRDGVGVYGHALDTGDSTNYGGYFRANGTSGMGVRAEASGAQGRGVFGTAMGSEGVGVYGVASYSRDVTTNYGGNFLAKGHNGHGVHGMATGSEGIGVYGEATHSEDFTTNYGGYFVAEGHNGHGVRGEATGIQGRGLLGYATGMNGIGVSGEGIGINGRGFQGVGSEYDFYAGGPGTDYGSPSSIRWKRNIQPIDNPLHKILQVRGVYFDWDAEHGGGHDVGMVAEEVGKVLPEIVEYEEDGIYASGMDYSKLTPLLVEAVKELKAEKDAEIAELKGWLSQMEILRRENAELRERITSLEAVMGKFAQFQEGGVR